MNEVARAATAIMRVYIADDEPIARNGLREMLRAFDDVAIVGEAGTGPAALAGIMTQHPDLVFVDIEMPGLDGFATLRALPESAQPAIIFVTAFERYALAAFEANAVDYLLKPFNGARLARALERGRRFVWSANREAHSLGAHAGEHLEHTGKAARQLALGAWRCRTNRLAVRDRGRLTFVEPDAVDWIESWGNYVRLFTGGRPLVARESLSTLFEQLDSTQFTRISRTVVVNGDRVHAIKPRRNGQIEISLAGGLRLIGSRRHRNQVIAFFEPRLPARHG